MPVRIISLFAVLTLLSNFSLTASARSWTYYDIREPRNQFVLERNPDRSAWMDSSDGAEFCGGNDLYWCFKAGDFQFAVPKGFRGKETEWTYDEVTYKLMGTSHRYILGQKYTMYFIERDFDQLRLRFLFTLESGLIGITTVGTNQGMVLILSGKCGFGASAQCYKAELKSGAKSLGVRRGHGGPTHTLDGVTHLTGSSLAFCPLRHVLQRTPPQPAWINAPKAGIATRAMPSGPQARQAEGRNGWRFAGRMPWKQERTPLPGTAPLSSRRHAG